MNIKDLKEYLDKFPKDVKIIYFDVWGETWDYRLGDIIKKESLKDDVELGGYYIIGFSKEGEHNVKFACRVKEKKKTSRRKK